MTNSKKAMALMLTAALTAIPVTAMAHGKKDKPHVDAVHDVSGFDQLEIGGVYILDVQVGEDFSVSTSGHAKEVENMTIDVDGDTLRIGHKKKRFGNRMKSKNGIQINITMPKLTAVSIGGVGEGQFSGIDTDRFEVEIGGVGELEFSGKCETLEIDVGGVGEIDARDLKCENAEVQLAGVGELDVYASHSADVQTAGVGEVNVYGNPEHVEKSKNFLSEVNIK